MKKNNGYIQMILGRWERFLNNGQLTDVVNLYTNNSSLVSTFDSIFINDLNGIHNYFEKLVNKHAKVKVLTVNITKIDDHFLEFGIYEFSYENTKINARFSMLSNGESIIHHHSSTCN